MVTLFFAVKPTLAIMFLRCSCSHVLLIVVHLIVNSVLYKSWSDDDYVGNGHGLLALRHVGGYSLAS